MSRPIIGALVGGLILFMWQFLSWSILGIHDANMKHSPNQDKVLDALEANLEEGTYFIPRMHQGGTAEQEEAYMQNRIGKPWATISYHKEMKMSMGMNMLRGFVIDFVAVLLLIWVLMPTTNFSKTFLSCIAVGLISYFTTSYLDSIWFETHSIPSLIDALVSWGTCGLWLGWWLNR